MPAQKAVIMPDRAGADHRDVADLARLLAGESPLALPFALMSVCLRLGRHCHPPSAIGHLVGRGDRLAVERVERALDRAEMQVKIGVSLRV